MQLTFIHTTIDMIVRVNKSFYAVFICNNPRLNPVASILEVKK